MSSEPSSHYLQRMEALVNVVHHCIAVSNACAGIRAPSGAHYWASVLFTSLCNRGYSLAVLVPYSPLAKKEVEHWDFASAGGIVRSIFEVRLAFFYLCVEQVTSEEWDCRWNLLNLHDCISRLDLFQDMPSAEKDVEGFTKQAEELKQRLRSNPFFLSLPPNRQKTLLNGQQAYLSPLYDVAVRAGVEFRLIRWLYKLLSAQVHGLPLSFYRMDEQNRGRGIYSETEEEYTSLCVSFALALLTRARDEMQALFPQAKKEAIAASPQE